MPIETATQPGKSSTSSPFPTNLLLRRMLGVIYYSGLCILPFAFGGLFYLILFETPGPDQSEDRASLKGAILLSASSFLMVLLAGLPLWRFRPKPLAFGTIWCGFLIVAVLALGEWVLRFNTPSWPTIGLHGVVTPTRIWLGFITWRMP